MTESALLEFLTSRGVPNPCFSLFGVAKKSEFFDLGEICCFRFVGLMRRIRAHIPPQIALRMGRGFLKGVGPGFPKGVGPCSPKSLLKGGHVLPNRSSKGDRFLKIAPRMGPCSSQIAPQRGPCSPKSLLEWDQALPKSLLKGGHVLQNRFS